MTECKNCPYFVENNKGYPYCCLYCSDIDFVIIHNLCKFAKKVKGCKHCEYWCPYTVKTIKGTVVIDGCAKYNDDVSNVVKYFKCKWIKNDNSKN